MIKQIISLLLIGFIISCAAGCSWFEKTQGVKEENAVKYPDIIPNNQGGAFTIYQVKNQRRQINEFYLQKINSDGSRPWGEKGVLIGHVEGNQHGENLRVFTDTNSNALAIWSNDLSGSTSVSKVSLQGDILWQQYSDIFMNTRLIISDGSGGIIFITNQLSLQKMNHEGELEWESPLNNIVSILQIVDDGYGGAIVLGYQNSNNFYNLNIQQVDAQGKTPWPSSSILLDTSAEVIAGNVIADGTGGCIIMWTASGGDENQTQYRFQLLRLDKGGNVLWKNEKSAIKEPTQLPASIFISGDRNGNNIVFWEDGKTMYGQTISLDGKYLWDKEKIIDGKFTGIVSTGSENGESIIYLNSVVYEGMGQRYLECQILNLNGESLLSQSENMKNPRGGPQVFIGQKIADDDLVNQFKFITCPDGEAGAVFAWGSSENLYSIEHSSVQKINRNGDLIWGKSGIQLDSW